MLRIGQVEATATSDSKYTDGSVAGGIAATRLRAAAFNAIQEELAHIVEVAGLALNVADNTQVYAALQKLLLSRANPFADIKADGSAAIATALTNLGLIDSSGYSGRLIGAPKIITTSGTYIPSPGCKLALGEAVGGGGGGGGCYLADSAGASAGGGGGSGGYSFFAFLNPVPTAVTIGSGGVMGAIAANATPANASSGGDTIFGSLCVAKGGYGGLSAGWAVPTGTSDMACTDGGGGGLAGTGDFTACGRWGDRGIQLARNGSAGYGAPSMLGSGGYRTTGTSGLIVPPTFGGGGLGNYRASGTSFAGTNGANGVCIIREFF